MSNHHPATLGTLPVAAPRKVNAKTIWRRMFDAWLRAYANRIDGNGNIICEL